MAEKILLKDQLFNPVTVAQLGDEYARAVPGFDTARFQREALGGFDSRELMARMDWMADCIDAQLPADFMQKAEALEAAMPAPLDPMLRDDDFGYFIHAIPGILAVRHGLEAHRARAVDLLYRATQRFSMEFYIRPFLNRWPNETLAALHLWVGDENYHVRRLVSEGTRPKLPWARAVTLTSEQTLPLLDRLHADPTRYVTRSVANHLNDLSKMDADLVLDRLAQWKTQAKQDPKELAWMTRHALRTLIKQGHVGAMSALGYDAEAPLTVRLEIACTQIAIGEALRFSCEIDSTCDAPVLVDYRISFARPGGKKGEKVFKLKQGAVGKGKSLVLKKSHLLKGDATTFKLYPGAHHLTVQVNGVDRAVGRFDLV